MAGEGTDADGAIAVPRTLDDARRLVEPPKEDDYDDEEEEIALPSANLPTTPNTDQAGKKNFSNDSLLNAIVGRKQSRDRSADSVQSSDSGKRVAFATENSNSPMKVGLVTSAPPASSESVLTANVAVESMRSLGNTLNPLKGFGSMNVMRGFGRSTSSGPPTPGPASVERPTHELQQAPAITKINTDAQSSLIKVLPPIERYLAVTSAGDLKISEIADLLDDYKRLASALKTMGAF